MYRNKVIEIAQAEDGYTEYPPYSNMTKYGQWYGLNGHKWCAIFVSWVFYHAGHPLGNIDSRYGFSSCVSGYDYWKSRNCFTKYPKAGDIVLYDLHKGGKITDHTGIFFRWIIEGLEFEAWEGNTSRSGDRDGGHVMLQQRKISEVRVFVVPDVYRI